MQRFIRVCVGSSALALSAAIIPGSAVAAQVGSSSGGFHWQRVAIPAPRLVKLRAGIHAANGQHPAIVPPFRYFNPGAVAAARAAAVRSGGTRSSVTAGSSAAAQAASSGVTWADFPGISLARQDALFGADQDLQPPDTQVAAGPGAVVEATNDTLAVWSKTGVLVAARDLNSFFPVPSGFGFSDPRLLYDQQSSRWFLSGFSVDSSLDSQTYLAISASSNPLGTWKIYTVENNSTSAVLTDQPMTGVCDDKVVLAWNEFTSSGTVFAGAQDLVLQKSTLLAGSALGTSDTQLFTTTNEFRLVPAQALSSTSTCWMTVNNASNEIIGSTSAPTLGVIAVTGTPNGTGGVSQSETDLAIAATSTPPEPRQKSGVSNDTRIDDRLLSAVWQSGVLWTSGTDACTPTGDTTTRDCIRLDEVNAPTGGTPTLALDVHDLSQNGLDEYYPAVSLDGSGDLYVSYNASSPTLNPGAYAAVSAAASPGTFGAPVTIAAGQAAYNGGTDSAGNNAALWGDYSAVAPDPSVPGAMWVAGEYATSDTAWGTATAEVSLTSPPAVGVAVAALSTSGVPYAQAPQLGAGWHSLGGALAAAPAVAAAPNPNGTSLASPLFIGPGTNHLLYIRGLTGGWQRLGPQDPSCLGSPAAVITGSTLTVACEGLNHALYYGTATVPASGLPVFTSAWKGLGGVLTTGPAMAPVGGVLTFFVRGTDGRIYTRTPTVGYKIASWACLGQPAAAKEATSQDTVFACEGNNHGLYVSANGGTGWGPTVKLSGTLAAGPAVGGTSRALKLLLLGTNKVIYEGTPTTSYTGLTGILATGVEAAALN